MASELSFAPGTLRVYIDRLFDKLAVADRLGMALRIIQAHLAAGN
jgi:DNA-binding NarL/FixJ family response regulator